MSERKNVDGAAIRKARETARLSTHDLADYLGIAELYLRNIESGRFRFINAKVADKLESYLGAAVVPADPPADPPAKPETRLRRLRGRPRQVPA